MTDCPGTCFSFFAICSLFLYTKLKLIIDIHISVVEAMHLYPIGNAVVGVKHALGEGVLSYILLKRNIYLSYRATACMTNRTVSCNF